MISDEQFDERHRLFPQKTPDSKEELWYRMLFEGIFDIFKIDSTLHTKVYQ